MKTIFIAYADESMAYSLKRIGRQARHLKVFDEVILYTPDDLSDVIKSHPLMQYRRGGGYWLWKPWIIQKTLQDHAPGDIVVYADSGSTLRKSPEWERLFGLMVNYDTICFQYAESFPEFAHWGNPCTKIKYWTKKQTLLFLDQYFHDSCYREFCKIWGGLLFAKNANNRLIRNWLDFYLKYPELIVDPSPDDMKDQEPGFAFHKHDQSIITALAYYDKTALILPEVSERYSSDSFVWASRCRAANFKEYLAWRIKTEARLVLGNDTVDKIKRIRR